MHLERVSNSFEGFEMNGSGKNKKITRRHDE